MQHAGVFHDMLRQIDDRLLLEIRPWPDQTRIFVTFKVPNCSADEFRGRIEEEIISIARSGILGKYELNIDGQAIGINYYKDTSREVSGPHYIITGCIANRLFAK
jgi:hypothetical protein